MTIRVSADKFGLTKDGEYDLRQNVTPPQTNRLNPNRKNAVCSRRHGGGNMVLVKSNEGSRQDFEGHEP